MARMIAIDLGLDSVTIAAAQEDTRVLEGPFRARVAVEGDELPTLDARLEALGRLLREHAALLAGPHIAWVSWPAARSSFHTIELPFDDDARIASTLRFELESEVAADLDEMLIGWRRSAEGEIRTVLLRKDALSALIKGFAQNGMDPKVVMTDADALAALATDDDQVRAFIDVGHSATVVVVAQGRRVLHARALAQSGRMMIQALVKALDIPWDAARAMLDDGAIFEDGDADDLLAPLPVLMQEDEAPGGLDDARLPEDLPPLPHRSLDDGEDRTDPGLRGQLPPAALQALQAVVSQLVAEVRTTLVAVEDDEEVELSEVVLVGRASRVSGLASALRADLGLAIAEPSDSFGPLAPGDAVARGLLSRALEHNPVFTQLRVDDLEWRGGRDWAWASLSYGSMAIVGGMIAVVLFGLWSVGSAWRERANLDKQALAVMHATLADLPPGVGVSDATDTLRFAQAKVQAAVDFFGADASVPPMIDLIYTLTMAYPPHPTVVVTLDTMDISEEIVQMTGVTDGFAQVDQIGESLTQSGRFGKVEAVPGNRTRDNKLNFTVSLQRDPAGGDGVEGGDE